METVPVHNNSKHKKVLVLLAANVVILTVIALFLFILFQTQLITYNANKPWYQKPVIGKPDLMPSITTIVNEIDVHGEFVKRAYTPTDDFFPGYRYPVEMTDRQDDELLGFRCTPLYSKGIDTLQYRDYSLPQAPDVSVTDQDIITFYEQLEAFSFAKNNTSFASFMYCDIEDGRSLVIYHSDYESIPEIIRLYDYPNTAIIYSYIGIIDQAGNFKQIATYYSFPKAGSPNKLLQFNAISSIVYLHASWGDVGGGRSGLFKVPLDLENEYITLMTCATGDRDAGAVGSCNINETY